VRNLIKRNRKYSKRINYEALKDLFIDDSSLPDMFTAPAVDEKVNDRHSVPTGDGHVEDDRRSEIEGEEGAIGVLPAEILPRTQIPANGEDGDGDEDADGEDESDKEENIGLGWEDAYEQEV
jgi:transcription factor IIIB 90 kDa subunit